MTVKQFAFSTYYLGLFLFVLVQLMRTAFAGSLAVAQAQTLKGLQQDRRQLAQQQRQLHQEIAKATSLSTIATQTDLTQFTTISTPIVVVSGEHVAWR